MDWKGHMLLGLVITAILAYLLHSLPLFVWSIPLILFSSILPDIDIDTSKVRQILNVGVIIVALALYVNSLESLINGAYVKVLAFIGAYFIIITFFKPGHRGITHTLFATIVYGGILYLSAGATAAIIGGVGYFSHLIGDKVIKVI